MRDYEREALRERVQREGSTVGASIPEVVEVDGEEIHLRRRVMELTATSDPAEDRRAEVDRLRRGLRGLRRELVADIDRPGLTGAEGDEIVERVAGIDRALNALAQLDAPGVAEQARRQARLDERRWMEFLREALGHEERRG